MEWLRDYITITCYITAVVNSGQRRRRLENTGGQYTVVNIRWSVEVQCTCGKYTVVIGGTVYTWSVYGGQYGGIRWWLEVQCTCGQRWSAVVSGGQRTCYIVSHVWPVFDMASIDIGTFMPVLLPLRNLLIDHWPLALSTDHWYCSLTIGTIHWPLAIHYTLSTIHYTLYTIHYPLSTVHWLQLSIHLMTTHLSPIPD